MTVPIIAPITSIADANAVVFGAIRDHGNDVDPAAYAAMSALYPSVVDRTASSAEALYASAKAAAPGDLQDALAVACMQLTDFCILNAWQDFAATDRGLKISGACRRILGLGDQAEADDPAVLKDFAPAT
jgi:hypothetical protein